MSIIWRISDIMPIIILPPMCWCSDFLAYSAAADTAAVVPVANRANNTMLKATLRITVLLLNQNFLRCSVRPQALFAAHISVPFHISCVPQSLINRSRRVIGQAGNRGIVAC